MIFVEKCRLHTEPFLIWRGILVSAPVRAFMMFFFVLACVCLACTIIGAVVKTPCFISVSGKKLLFTFTKKSLSLKGKNSGAESWGGAPLPFSSQGLIFEILF